MIPQSHRGVLLLALCLFGLARVQADGGTVRLSEERNGYRVTVFTAPAPLRAGPVDVSVLVEDADSGRPRPELPVLIRARRVSASEGGGEPTTCPATTEAATNKLLRSALFDLPEAGWWQIEVVVEGGRGPTEAAFTVEAADALPRWPTVWPWVGWPAGAVALFAVHQWLAGRKRRGEISGAMKPC